MAILDFDEFIEDFVAIAAAEFKRSFVLGVSPENNASEISDARRKERRRKGKTKAHWVPERLEERQALTLHDSHLATPHLLREVLVDLEDRSKVGQGLLPPSWGREKRDESIPSCLRERLADE